MFLIDKLRKSLLSKYIVNNKIDGFFMTKNTDETVTDIRTVYTFNI